MKIAFSIGLCLILGTLAGRCQGLVLDTTAYVLGVDDAVAITVVGIEELNAKTLGVIRIDHQGDLILPLAGRIHAGGLTVDGLEREIGSRLLGFMNRPEVSVAIAEYRSHPVSVLGAVRAPGVYQVSGLKSLYEVLSLAGGLGPDAGNTIKITRSASVAILPLPNVKFEKGGEFQVGQLNVRQVLAGDSPEKNVVVLANDVITVPKSDLVYVV